MMHQVHVSFGGKLFYQLENRDMAVEVLVMMHYGN